MLWVCIHLPLLPLEVFSQKESCGPLIVEETVNNRRQVLLANDQAQAAGIQPGTSISTALGLSSALEIRKKDERSEWQILEQLATWAYQFTPHITLKEHTMLLEVESSLSLFHGKDALCQALIDGLHTWGYQHSIACCSTPKAAQLLAQHKHLLQQAKTPSKESIDNIFFTIDDIQQCPIELLHIADKEKKQLKSMGLTQLQHLYALPAAALNRRFGTGLSLQLQQIKGETSDIQRNFKLPRTFDQSIHFVEELINAHSILFPLNRLLGYLENYLTARQLLCNSFVVTFYERDQRQHSLVMQLTQPHYRCEHLLNLVKLKFENISFQQPVIGVKVSARYFSSTAEKSGDLFGSPQQEKQSQNTLIDTLKSRLGEDAINYIILNNDHRPEIAAQIHPNPNPQKKTSHKKAAPKLTRPLWLLPTPQPIHNKKGIPIYGEQLQLITGPERIETGWWDRLPINRDYYVAKHPTGLIYWIFVDREKQQLSQPQSHQWFLHGVFG